MGSLVPGWVLQVYSHRASGWLHRNAAAENQHELRVQNVSTLNVLCNLASRTPLLRAAKQAKLPISSNALTAGERAGNHRAMTAIRNRNVVSQSTRSGPSPRSAFRNANRNGTLDIRKAVTREAVNQSKPVKVDEFIQHSCRGLSTRLSSAKVDAAKHQQKPHSARRRDSLQAASGGSRIVHSNRT